MEEENKYKDIKVIRKRYFPNEEIDISGDEILYLDEKLLVTKWLPIKPRDDMSMGISWYFLDKGWKVSKIYNNGEFVHYYCDICRYEIEPNKKYKMIDLLADVIVNEDLTYKVVDMEELVDMLEDKTLPPREYMLAIKTLACLLREINEGRFPFKELDMYK